MLLIKFCFVFLLGLAVNEAVGGTLGYKGIKENVRYLGQIDESEDSDEIVGGNVVDIRQFPYQAELLVYQLHFCGGSIISEDYVLTAAHCIVYPANQFQIHVGSSYAEKGGKLYNVANIISHPQYNSETTDYDIAVMKASSRMLLDGITTKAVRLADSRSFLKPGDNIIASGWGLTSEDGQSSDVLRAVAIPVTSKEYCSRYYLWLTDRMLCAGYEGGKDSCQGDSGGPAVDEKSLIQFGVISFGHGCGRKGVPGVYAYIPVVREWIRGVTGI